MLAKFTFHQWCIAKIVAFSYILKKFCLSNTSSCIVTNLLELYSCVPIIWIAQFPRTWGFTGPIGKVNRALTGWQVTPQGSSVNQIYLQKRSSEIDLTPTELEQLRSVYTNWSKLYKLYIGDRVNMLLLSVSNTINKCLPKNI